MKRYYCYDDMTFRIRDENDCDYKMYTYQKSYSEDELEKTDQTEEVINQAVTMMIRLYKMLEEKGTLQTIRECEPEDGPHSIELCARTGILLDELNYFRIRNAKSAKTKGDEAGSYYININALNDKSAPKIYRPSDAIYPNYIPIRLTVGLLSMLCDHDREFEGTFGIGIENFIIYGIVNLKRFIEGMQEYGINITFRFQNIAETLERLRREIFLEGNYNFDPDETLKDYNQDVNQTHEFEDYVKGMLSSKLEGTITISATLDKIEELMTGQKKGKTK